MNEFANKEKDDEGNEGKQIKWNEDRNNNVGSQSWEERNEHFPMRMKQTDVKKRVHYTSGGYLLCCCCCCCYCRSKAYWLDRSSIGSTDDQYWRPKEVNQWIFDYVRLSNKRRYNIDSNSEMNVVQLLHHLHILCFHILRWRISITFSMRMILIHFHHFNILIHGYLYFSILTLKFTWSQFDFKSITFPF